MTTERTCRDLSDYAGGLVAPSAAWLLWSWSWLAGGGMGWVAAGGAPSRDAALRARPLRSSKHLVVLPRGQRPQRPPEGEEHWHARRERCRSSMPESDDE
jgi:hypothetical protein